MILGLKDDSIKKESCFAIMAKWQWLYGGTWVNCTDENHVAISTAYNNPTLEPMYLTNALGELWGTLDSMKFRVHGDDVETNTIVRRGPEPGESPLFAVIEEGGDFVLPMEITNQLFSGSRPVVGPIEVSIGAELFKSENHKLYKFSEGQFEERSWRKTGISKAQFEDMTKTRFVWQFKGPFRWEKMQKAISMTSSDPEKKESLDQILETFDPEEDLTEYGPYQFPDYLSVHGLDTLAFEVMDHYNSIPHNEWKDFDPQTNVQIESARTKERPGAGILVNDHKYMVIFDGSAGSSGADSVVIRPTRYQKMLESIEEQFIESESRAQQQTITDLLSLLSDIGVSPRMFIFNAMHRGDDVVESIPEEHRERVQSLISQMRSSTGSLGTRIQSFLPTLLTKFNECEIRMGNSEKLDPKPMDESVCETLANGLRRPQRWQCSSFKEMISFLGAKQSWLLPGQGDCVLCGETKQQTLVHCGHAGACMKCWLDTLNKTHMSCPFCRGSVEEGQLKLAAKKAGPPKKTKTAKKKSRKRKRDITPEELLAEIQKDGKYSGITGESSFSMRRWYTILVRRKLLSIGQLPKNSQMSCNLVKAMKEFKLI